MSDTVLSQFTQSFKAKEEKLSTRKIRVGIVGTGWIASSHVDSYKKMDDVEIVAATDLIPGKAEAFMEEYGVSGVKFYPSADEMYADQENLKLDAVSVCTYNTTHMSCTVGALKAGIPVLLEKPLTVTLDEAVEIAKAEKKYGVPVSVGFQPRGDKNMQMIKKIVESGALGQIYYIQTGGGRRRGIPNSTFIEKSTAGIGALGDIGCYSLDMVLNAIGYPMPLTVSGYTSNFFGTNPKYATADRAHTAEENAARFDVDDFAAAFVRLEPGKYGAPSGIILDFRIAWAMHVDTPGDTIIFGTEGALRIPSTECWNGSVGGPMTLYHDVCGERTETVIPIINGDGDLFGKKCRAFLNMAMNGGEAPVPVSQIIINQAIIDGINRSAECGKEVEINIPEI